MTLSLRWQVLILVLGVTIVSLAIAGLFMHQALSNTLRHHIGLQALGVAQAVAEMPLVKAWVGQPGGEVYIQPLAESIRLRTGFSILVVIDTNSIRYAHPVPERIGQRFVGGDEGRALQGEEYISQAMGTLGLQQRAFAPIRDDAGIIIGAVVVGDLMPQIDAPLGRMRTAMYTPLALGLAVGSLGAVLLSAHIKKTLFGMEPNEIAAALQSRETILQSVREGIVAVDKDGHITLLNDVARRYLEVGDDAIGKPVDTVVKTTRLPSPASSS
ncbi:MAG: hypothetical protein KGZ50_07230 [Peptococcaceae bacterium]|nr:hypothetical protein [Peptococcaceae bacterium]